MAAILDLSFESVGLSVQVKKRKTNFQDDGHGCHLGFPIWMILAIFYYKHPSPHPIPPPMFPTEFQVNWYLNSGEEAKN